MIKDKKQVKAMINKYLTDKEGVNALGFISYHTFDKELIAKDYEAINDFFRENFNLYNDFINYQDLLKDVSGNTWLEIDTIFDLELLDELIAFGIASKVFNENIQIRFQETMNFGFALNEDPENLVRFKEDENYIKFMKNKVIAESILEISEEIKRCYEKVTLQDDYFLERKKELLISWWDEGMKEEDDEYTREYFLELLTASDLNGIIFLIYSLYSQNFTAVILSKLIELGTIISELKTARAEYYRYTHETKKDLDILIKKMFDKFNEMDQKKKRLS